MFPIGDENPTLRTPIVTYGLLASLAAVWLLVQGGGFDERALVGSICEFGLIAGEITGRVAEGTRVPLAPGLGCTIDRSPSHLLTPITSMFMHGGWGHLLGNALFLWVFGNNVEDVMGRFRFVLFYLLCGLAAAGTQVLVDPSAAVPMVGASGAISGVLGGYLILYPRVRVRVLFIWVILIQIIRVPAYLVLLWWIGLQVLLGLPQLTRVEEAATGVAFWAHIGGFVAGVLLIKLFANQELVRRHRSAFLAR